MHGVSLDTYDQKGVDKTFSGMVQREWEEMIVNKCLYDAEHPDNKKKISNQQMMQIARHKTIQELSAPEAEEAE